VRIEDLGMQATPFHARGQPVVFVHYQAQQAADEFLQRVLEDNRGIGLLSGIESSGKTTIVSHFVRNLPANIPVAVVDATGIVASELLATILTQFGCEGPIQLTDDLLNLLKKFVVEDIQSNQAPLLVLENINNLDLIGLRVLCELATLTNHQRFALRFILVNKRACSRIIDSPKIAPIRARLVDTFELGPLTAREALKYLHAKLRASGLLYPHRILPIATCVELHRESGGWPGELDSLVLRAIEQADWLPIRGEHINALAAQRPPDSDADSSTADRNFDRDVPKLLVTMNGKLLQEFGVTQPKVSIGRARQNDLVMTNQYVSKYHALLIFKNSTMILVDLKSANGIYVNSRRVRSAVLRHDDVIQIGNHRIKIFHPSSRVGVANSEPDHADTSILKTVADMRRAVTRKILPFASTKRHRSK
jgi:pSer/pThr/pTyr-binding forkhead associated (FHA) protein/type II secretory pathway predicted ATPase ExeA